MNKMDRRRWDWPAVFFLSVAFWVAAQRLEITDWTPDLERVIPVTMIGVLLGMLLGYSKFPRRFTFLYSLVFTVIVIPWQLALTLNPDMTWLERVSGLGGRLWLTFLQFTANLPIEDPLLFIFAMMVVYWIASQTAGFAMLRTGRPWFGLALLAITTLIIEYYDPPRTVRGFYTSIFAILVILLISRLHYLSLRRHWEAIAVPVDSETGFDWMRASVLSSLVLVILAWNIPTWIRAISPQSVERREYIQAWIDLRERLSNLVTPLSGSAPSEGFYYENNIPLGTTISTSEAIVFEVTSSEPRPGGARYYWRARTYDRYEDGKWSSTFGNLDAVTNENTELPIPTWYQRFTASFNFSFKAQSLRNFFIPGLVINVNRPAQVVGRQMSETYTEAATLLAVPPLRSGETYRVKASIAAPTINFLQSSPAEYPNWIYANYLQLPADFPQNLRSLAQEITSGLETPYEKAVAITNYLRTHIDYQATIEPGPSYMDPIEYFLFVSRKGFCNYYAAAEVLMLRSIGIPARLAVGFAEGEMDEKRTHFTVRSRDAHAWPEVYFTNFGWIEFEPTVAQSELVRQEETPRLPSDSELAIQPPEMLSDSGNERLRGVDQDPALRGLSVTPPENQSSPAGNLTWIVPVALAVLAGSAWFAIKRVKRTAITFPHPAIVLEKVIIQRGFTTPAWIRERARLARLTPLERYFNAVPKSLKLLGKAANPSLTPAEQVSQLIKALPQSEQPAKYLLAELHRGMYTPYPVNLDSARINSREIKRLARQLWVRRLLRLDEQMPGF